MLAHFVNVRYQYTSINYLSLTLFRGAALKINEEFENAFYFYGKLTGLEILLRAPKFTCLDLFVLIEFVSRPRSSPQCV